MSDRRSSTKRAPPEVRTARRNDAAGLREFFIEAWKEVGPGALGFAGATEESIKEIASEEFLAKRLASPNTRIVVVQDEGRIVGFASVRRGAEGEAELAGVVVLERATGRGLGTRLLRRACETAVKQGAVTLVVKTEASNERAIGFYRRNGFTDATKTSVKVGRTMVPTQVLEKRLRPTRH